MVVFLIVPNNVIRNIQKIEPLIYYFKQQLSQIKPIFVTNK